MKMEHPYNLLQIVVKQHYLLRPEVLEKTSKIIADYNNDNNSSYAQTLSAIYQAMSDLPSDILLYYLTTVPLPKNEEIESSDSPLPGLVKRLLVPSYHNSVRPVLLKYLNEHSPQTEISSKSLSNTVPDNESSTSKNIVELTEDITASALNNTEKDNVQSVIDENIKQSKNRAVKGGRCKKNKIIKTYQVKSLGLLCATNICKFFNVYAEKYTKMKLDAWKIVHDKNLADNDKSSYYKVIKDSEKKLKWLNMFKTGHVPIEILEEEYGDSEIFYLERRHLLNNVSEDLLELQPDLLRSIDDLFERLSK